MNLNELDIVKLILSAHQTAYAQAHNTEGRNVIESDNIAIGYASVELANLLAAHDQKVRREVCEGCGIANLKLVSICAQCIRTTSLEARKLEREKVLEEAALLMDDLYGKGHGAAAHIRSLASGAEEKK